MVELLPCEQCEYEELDYTIHLVYDDCCGKVWIIKCGVCGNIKPFKTTFGGADEMNKIALDTWNTRADNA